MALLFPVKTEAPPELGPGAPPYALAFPSSHGPPQALFRFGFASSPPSSSWPRSATPPLTAMSYSDEYDDPAPPPDRIVRRRSSKGACWFWLGGCLG